MYVMMIVVGLLMMIIPFAVFMGLGTAFGMLSSDPRLLFTYFLLAAIVGYGTSFGAFVLIQRMNCGSVKNVKQAASNATLVLGGQILALLLAWFIPGLRKIVTNLLPPDLDPAISDSVGYSYYSLWASLFGVAIGGSLSGICT